MSFRLLALMLVAALAALLLTGQALAKERTWTDSDGRQMKAEFVREIDGEVTFLKEGKLVTIPLDKLSEKDQQIIRDLMMGKPVPDEDAGAPTTPSAGTSSAESKATPSGDEKPASPRITIETRTWTDDRGNKTNAKFIRVNGNDVVLNRTGKILTVSFFSLSEEDQQYIRDVLTQQGKEELIPAERPVASGNSAAGQPTGGVAAPATGPVTSGSPSSPFPPRGGGRFGPGVPTGMPGGAEGRPSGMGPSGMGPSGMGPSGMGPGGMRPGGMGPSGMGPGGIGPSGVGPGGMGPGYPSGIGPGSGIPGGVGPSGAGPGYPSGIGPGGGYPGGMGPAGMGPGNGVPSGIGSGMMPGGGMTPGYGSGMGPRGESSFPSGPQAPEFPTASIPSPSFPSGPTFQQVYQCSGCKREISQEQSTLDKCPYCGTYWVYKTDGTGNKQFSGMAGVAGARNMVIGVLVVIFIVVLGAVGGFIGIMVAIVRAVSRPAPRPNYRRW